MTHDDINKGWNPDSPWCGKLIQRHEHVWHFGVALDDDLAMAWGEKHLGGRLVLHQINNRFTETEKVILLPKEQVLTNLHLSLDAFDGKWYYNAMGWNCEHWARLAATGQPVSYQIEQMVFGLLNGFGLFGLAWRHEAINELVKCSSSKTVQLQTHLKLESEEDKKILTSDEAVANSPVG